MASKARESFGLNASMTRKHMYIDLCTMLENAHLMKGGDALLPDARLTKAHYVITCLLINMYCTRLCILKI